MMTNVDMQKYSRQGCEIYAARGGQHLEPEEGEFCISVYRGEGVLRV